MRSRKITAWSRKLFAFRSSWWQFGLIAREDWVDQHICATMRANFSSSARPWHHCWSRSLRCDMRLYWQPSTAGSVFRRGSNHWIGAMSRSQSGQIGYQKEDRERPQALMNGWKPLSGCFRHRFRNGDLCLLIHAPTRACGCASLRKTGRQDRFRPSPLDCSLRSASPCLRGVLYLRALWKRIPTRGRHHSSPYLAFASGPEYFWRQLFCSWPGTTREWRSRQAAIRCSAPFRTVSLAAAGTIKYAVEKTRSSRPRRKTRRRRPLSIRGPAARSTDRSGAWMAKSIDLAEANRGANVSFAILVCTRLPRPRSWLRSHRERPLHPPIGSIAKTHDFVTGAITVFVPGRRCHMHQQSFNFVLSYCCRHSSGACPKLPAVAGLLSRVSNPVSRRSRRIRTRNERKKETVACKTCGGPLPAREGAFVLKYFRVSPRRGDNRIAVASRSRTSR